MGTAAAHDARGVCGKQFLAAIPQVQDGKLWAVRLEWSVSVKPFAEEPGVYSVSLQLSNFFFKAAKSFLIR